MTFVQGWAASDSRRLLRVPTGDDDKFSRGVVGVRTGSDAYPGAAVLGVEAAWRAGAGYVRFVGGRRVADAVIARRPETVATDPSSSPRVDCWVIGSGTDAATRSSAESDALRGLLGGRTPIVVDAGAIDLAIGASAPLIVTPHAGEHARLRHALGLSAPGADRAADAAETARALGGTVLLKGARTLVADPEGRVIGLDPGTGWLATAGTGDVLAGVIGAVLAANPDAATAEVAATGAWLHGAAARIASGSQDGATGHPIVALDVAAALPHAIAELLP